MVEVFKITNDMREMHQKRIDEFVMKNNRNIKAAVERGSSTTCFYPYKDDPDYAEVRNIFEKNGYRVKPTGYIGGVWQLTEDICW